MSRRERSARAVIVRQGVSAPRTYHPHLSRLGVYPTARWKRVRASILARDHYTCHWCGKHATQADHVRALAEGGSRYDPANLVASCASCNGRRGAETGNKLLFGKRARDNPALPNRSHYSGFDYEGPRSGAIRV